MENQPDEYVNQGMWELIIMPEEFCIDSLAHVLELFLDLNEIGARDHVQFPTAVFYRSSDGS